jgi:hypothetical protein
VSLDAFILSSFHRPLLSLTRVLICWLGEAQGRCSESRIVVCMCDVVLPSGGLNRCACWPFVGLGRLFGAMPDLLGFIFPLAVFLVSFCFDCVCCFVTAPGWQRAVAVG